VNNPERIFLLRYRCKKCWRRLKLKIIPELASRLSNMSEIKVEAVFDG